MKTMKKPELKWRKAQGTLKGEEIDYPIYWCVAPEEIENIDHDAEASYLVRIEFDVFQQLKEEKKKEWIIQLFNGFIGLRVPGTMHEAERIKMVAKEILNKALIQLYPLNRVRIKAETKKPVKQKTS